MCFEWNGAHIILVENNGSYQATFGKLLAQNISLLLAMSFSKRHLECDTCNF